MTKAQVKELVQRYWSKSFPSPITVLDEIAQHGSDNYIFSTEGEKYVFRIIFMKPESIHDGSQIYIALHQAGIQVPLPLKTDNFEYCIPADLEGRIGGYSIHTFVDGDEEVDKSRLVHYISHMGEELGRFHSALYHLDINDFDLRGRDFVHYETDTIGFHPPLEEEIPEHPLVQEMYYFWNNWRDQLELDEFTSGIVHGDIGPGCNIMMKEDKITAFIDLMGTGGGYYMQDLASFVMYGGLFREDRKEWLEEFKTHYLKTSPVRKEEFDKLPFFLLWRFLIQALYFGWRIRTEYTQGNTPESDNHDGMNHALGVLSFWKKKYKHLML